MADDPAVAPQWGNVSSGRKIPWPIAAELAQRFCQDLRPVARRVKTAGSVRRRKQEVGDIEIVVEPLIREVGLFGERLPDVDLIRSVADRWGTIKKGGQKMIQVEISEGICVDLFLVTPPAQWGSILAIRTGPAELGKHAVTCMRERGLQHVDGHIEDRRGEWVPTPREEDFFDAAGLPCLPPRLRATPAAFRSLNS